jgi:hypothetical protein
MVSMSYETGTYVKGDDVKVAKNAKQAVALAFEGYRLKDEGDQAAAESTAVEAQPKADEAVRDVPSKTEATPAKAPVPAPPKQKD